MLLLFKCALIVRQHNSCHEILKSIKRKQKNYPQLKYISLLCVNIHLG